MTNYASMTHDQLKEELARVEGLLQDAQDERSFTAKQTSMHINASVFMQLDHDIERYTKRIQELRATIEARPA